MSGNEPTAPWVGEEPANDDDFEQIGVGICEKLPPGFPDEWRDLQVSVSVGIIFTEWNGINRAFFERFAVSSVEEALLNLVVCDDVFLLYHFYVDGMYPAFRWDADWPLYRRSDSALVRRQQVQGTRPWEWNADRTLFEIRREPLNAIRGRLYLRVGGRMQAAATQTWNECATPFRRLYRKSVGDFEVMKLESEKRGAVAVIGRGAASESSEALGSLSSEARPSVSAPLPADLDRTSPVAAAAPPVPQNVQTLGGAIGKSNESAAKMRDFYRNMYSKPCKACGGTGRQASKPAAGATESVVPASLSVAADTLCSCCAGVGRHAMHVKEGQLWPAGDCYD